MSYREYQGRPPKSAEKPTEPAPRTMAEAQAALTRAGVLLRGAHSRGEAVGELLRLEVAKLATLVKQGLLPAWRVKRYLVGIGVANSSGTLLRVAANKIVDKALEVK